MSSGANIGSRVSSKATAVVATCVLALALALGLSSSVGVNRAWAGGDDSLDVLSAKTYTLSYKGKAHDTGHRDYFPTEAMDKKITSVKSSKKAIATAKACKMMQCDGSAVYYLRVTLKKAGTTKISFKHNGKSYAVRYRVKKYANPLGSLKVGSRDFVSYCNLGKLDGNCSYASNANVPVSAFSGKVRVKVKSGWKINQIIVYPKNSGSKVIKNGRKVKDAWQLGVLLENKKTGQVENLYLSASSVNLVSSSVAKDDSLASNAARVLLSAASSGEIKSL